MNTKFNHSLGHLFETHEQSRIPLRRDTNQVSLVGTTESLASRMDVDTVHRIFDQAERGDVTELFALYRDVLVADGHIGSELGKRKLAVIGDQHSIHPADKENPDDVQAAEFVESCLDDYTGFHKALVDLLDSTLWPVVVMRKGYRPSGIAGHPYCLSSLTRVEDERIDYQQDGRLQLYNVMPNGVVDRSRSYPIDPEQHIIHRNHLFGSNIPDWFGGPMRSLVFWWLFSAQDRDWWARFLDRYGSPFLVGRYHSGDEESKATLQNAFQWGTRIGGLVVDTQTQIEVQQAAASQSGDAFKSFYDLAQREKSKIILGQSLSANSDPQGLGNGASDLQGSVREDIRQSDAMLLGAGLRNGLFTQFLRINRFKGAPPIIRFGAEDAESLESLTGIIKAAKEAGLELADDSIAKIGERSGLTFQRSNTAPSPGESPLLTPLSAARPNLLESNAAIAHQAAPALAKSLQIPASQIAADLSASADPADLEQRLRRRLAAWPTPLQNRMLEGALAAYALNSDETSR